METIKFVQIAVVCSILNLSLRKLIKAIDVAVSTMMASQLKIGVLSTTIDIKTLASMLNAHPDTIRKSIARLTQAGILQVTHRKGRSNIYTFNLLELSNIENTPSVEYHITDYDKTNSSIVQRTSNLTSESQPFNNKDNSNTQIISYSQNQIDLISSIEKEGEK